MEALLKRTRFFILLIIFIGLLLYVKSLTNGFVGDDYLQIVNNIKVHSILNIPSFFAGSTYENGGADFITGIFYRPVMMSVFAVIYSVSGNTPLLFHLAQVLLHIINTVLLFFFLRRFFPNVISFFVSLIFLVHPVNSESVLYIANFQEVLYFFFGMLALLFVSMKKSGKNFTYLIPLMILLSLFSKESGVLFIFVILAYTFLFDKDRKRFKFFIVSLSSAFGIYLFFRYVVAQMFSANYSLAPITNAGVLERILNIPAIVFYYLHVFFYPLKLSAYQFWFIKTVSINNFWLPLFISVFFLILITSGYLWVLKKNKNNSKIYLFFMIWFTLGIALHLQILPLDATVADRWFYFPIVGILGIFTVLLRTINFKKLDVARNLLVFAITLIVVLLAARTYIRISDWQDNLTLLSHDVVSPSDFISENSLAAALIQDGQFEKAKPHVELSINTHPYSVNYSNMAIIYAAKNNQRKAKQYFQKAISMGQNLTVFENYANYLLYFDDYKEALQFSQKAIKVFPKSAKLFLVLAESEYLQNNITQALKDAVKSYQIDPNDKTADILLMIQNNKPLLINRQ